MRKPRGDSLAMPEKPKINVSIRVDASVRRLGEVTNAYVTVANVGEIDVSSVVVTLKANDQTSQHPDRQKFIQYLPIGHQATVDLTKERNLLDNTGIDVIVTTSECVVE